MLDWLLAAGRGSTKLVEPPYVPPFYCVYITQTGLGAGIINSTTPSLARPSVPFFRGPKLLLQFIDSYHDFLPPAHRAVCPGAPSFDGSPRSAAVKRQGLG
jgi:hypothetical protein